MNSSYTFIRSLWLVVLKEDISAFAPVPRIQIRNSPCRCYLLPKSKTEVGFISGPFLHGGARRIALGESNFMRHLLLDKPGFGFLSTKPQKVPKISILSSLDPENSFKCFSILFSPPELYLHLFPWPEQSVLSCYFVEHLKIINIFPPGS